MQAQSNSSAPDLWTPTKYGAEVKMTGEKIELCTSARSGDGKFRFIWTLAPGKRGPNEHCHVHESEQMEVVSGTFRVWLDGVQRDYGPGEVITIGRGVRHRFLNPGKVPAVGRAFYDSPRMEDVFVPLAVSAYPGKPGFKHMARMLVYLLEDRPTVPTSKWEVRIMSAVARVFRLFGVKAQQPVYDWDE